MEGLDKFYLKSIDTRKKLLVENSYISNVDSPILSEEKADLMIENYIHNFQLPLGIAMNFIINNKEYLIPMSIEEPSVIAAASNGAKILGNIETSFFDKNMVGQIVLTGNFIEDPIKLLEDNREYLYKEADNLTSNMKKRGGGLKKLWFDRFKDDKDDFLSIYFEVDTCDAMGANSINTMLETISSKIEALFPCEILLRIISNKSRNSFVEAKTSTPVSRLDKDIDKARKIAKKIEQASRYAKLDPYRAATHNKGIMNGIDALVLATGNDWRAVNASLYTYIYNDTNEKTFTTWKFDEESDILLGSIKIPMPVATIGGTIKSNKCASWSFDILGQPNAKQLGQIIAALGLVQNFAAIRAIVTEGIQRGHMSLHARNVASQAGANKNEIIKVVNLLKKADKINIEKAREILAKIRKS